MKRRANWRPALVEYARSVMGREYEWAETDCGMIVRGAVEAMADDDIPDMPAWDTRVGALRVASRGLDRVLGAEMGATLITNPRAAAAGDIAITDDEHGGIAISLGDSKWLTSTPERDVFVERMTLDANAKIYRL